METNQGNQGTKAESTRRKAGYGTIGVTATAAALFAVAIFLGARHAGEKGSPSAEPAPAALPAGGGVVAAADPPPAKHPPRHLEAANRKELETTLPKGAPSTSPPTTGILRRFDWRRRFGPSCWPGVTWRPT